MNPSEMVIGIVLIITIGRVLRSYFDARGSKMSLLGGQEDGDSRRLRQEVQMLKDRIAVLERLATDDTNAARLDREIEKLRDHN
jgi:hypothetical protein